MKHIGLRLELGFAVAEGNMPKAHKLLKNCSRIDTEGYLPYKRSEWIVASSRAKRTGPALATTEARVRLGAEGDSQRVNIADHRSDSGRHSAGRPCAYRRNSKSPHPHAGGGAH